MKKKRTGRKILIIILIILIIAQFIQPPKNNGSALGSKDITAVVQVPDSVMSILKVSCYDCHSDYTNYPWYSRITPVNWWLNMHIVDGKKDLNFTHFASYTPKKMNKKLDEVAELVENGAMPLDSYLWIHKNAKLSEDQRKLLIDWAETARTQLPPVN